MYGRTNIKFSKFKKEVRTPYYLLFRKQSMKKTTKFKKEVRTTYYLLFSKQFMVRTKKNFELNCKNSKKK